MKYIPVVISGVVVSVGKEIQPGYTESIVSTIFPSDEELEAMTTKQTKTWQKENNKRMNAICKFLNENPEL